MPHAVLKFARIACHLTTECELCEDRDSIWFVFPWSDSTEYNRIWQVFDAHKQIFEWMDGKPQEMLVYIIIIPTYSD